jgi:hypothetical protein
MTHRITSLLATAGLWLGLSLTASAQAPAPAAAPAACPPVAQQPTADQLAAAQAGARDRGFLWRLSKGGRTSFLYGTIHLGKLEWAPPGPSVVQALSSAEVVALELDITDPATLTRLQRALGRKPDTPALPATLQRQLAQETAAACLPPQALADQLPAAQALSLTLLSARWEGLDPGYAQELVLGGFAQARNLPVVALETVEEQIGALLPSTPAETERFITQALSQLRSGAARRGAARLAQAWAMGRLEELASYEQWCECVTTEDDRQMMRRLNDDRNPALASRIDRLHTQGRSVFAAVGALHMTGPKALPELLRQRGFTVERVTLNP